MLVVFLDWEKAFDKVVQSKMTEALRRLRIPAKVIQQIELLYENPRFAVRTENKMSDDRIQETGIRQGCPLSPYLFVLLMTVLFHDVQTNLDGQNMQDVKEVTFRVILYADDTLLFQTGFDGMEQPLHSIEERSKYHNMKLNKDKCELLKLGRFRKEHANRKLLFLDNTELKEVEEVIYLGACLTKKINITREIKRRISLCIPIVRSLKLFWDKADCSIAWKLNVYNAVIVAKLLYGLETVCLTEEHKSKLNAFQAKGIRRILGIPPTFIDRSCTNDMAVQRANENIRNETAERHTQTNLSTNSKRNALPKHKTIKQLADLVDKRALTLLGHIL
jgi:hypothetical protein